MFTAATMVVELPANLLRPPDPAGFRMKGDTDVTEVVVRQRRQPYPGGHRHLGT